MRLTGLDLLVVQVNPIRDIVVNCGSIDERRLSPFARQFETHLARNVTTIFELHRVSVVLLSVE